MNMKICIDKKISNYHSKRNYYKLVCERRKKIRMCVYIGSSSPSEGSSSRNNARRH